MCCEKTGIWRGSNPGLSGDFTFDQLLDNARNPRQDGLAVASFFAQIAVLRELNCANARCSCFYKRTEAKRVVK